MQEPWDHPSPDHQHEHDERHYLAVGEGQFLGEFRERPGRRAAAQKTRNRRQQHQRQDHDDVLDDQPTDGDAPALRLDQPALLQRAQQHHGAGDREGEAEHQTGGDRPAHRPGESHAEQRRGRDLRHRAGDGDGAHREEVLQREVQPDAEHQQDHADLGELVGKSLVGDIAGREGPDRDARQQISDQRRNPQPLRARRQDEGQDQADHDGRDQRCVMRHRPLFTIWRS
jgi:hypothetical protein